MRVRPFWVGSVALGSCCFLGMMGCGGGTLPALNCGGGYSGGYGGGYGGGGYIGIGYSGGGYSGAATVVATAVATAATPQIPCKA